MWLTVPHPKNLPRDTMNRAREAGLKQEQPSCPATSPCCTRIKSNFRVWLPNLRGSRPGEARTHSTKNKPATGIEPALAPRDLALLRRLRIQYA
jgi:hypothetical protein